MFLYLIPVAWWCHMVSKKWPTQVQIMAITLTNADLSSNGNRATHCEITKKSSMRSTDAPGVEAMGDEMSRSPWRWTPGMAIWPEVTPDWIWKKNKKTSLPLWDLGPISQSSFNSPFKYDGKLVCCDWGLGHQITTNFYTGHESYALMSCAVFCSNH